MTYGITNAGGGKSADLGTKTITANGTYSAATDGLDGYSEVTANVQSAPTLQSKIARQNGTVTADQGYDGLSSVDVGVGQIGDTYSCANKTGNAIAQYDKVWLTYREVQPSQSVYAQPIYNYEASIGFVANNQQTGLLYRQSNNNGNLFNLLNFTVEDLSSLALFNTQYTNFAYQVGDKYFFCGGYNTINTWLLDTSAQAMTEFISGAFKDYVTGFYTTYNRYSSRLYDPNGVSHTVPAGYDGMPGGGSCLYGYVKNGTTYMWYKDYNSGQHVCSVDMNTYELTHVANMGGGTSLIITNKTSDSEYLLDCVGVSFYSSRHPFKIISTTTYGDVTDSVLPASWAGISSTPAIVQFDERTGILIAINAPTASGNSLNLQDIKLAKYNPSTKVFDDITAIVNLPNYDFYTNTASSYGITFWLSSDYTNFAICYRTTKAYGRPGVDNSLTVLQLTPADGWVISSMNSDSLTGYAAANIAAGATGNVIVGTKIEPTKKYNLLDRVKDDSNNEIGTVSGFFTDANNVEYAVVCLDAQYRASGLNWSSTSAAVTNLPLYNDTTWGPWEAKETATFNTQKISDFAYSGACSHCRSKSFTIDGTTYYGQLPNLAELNDIMRNRSSIYSLDVTTSTTSSTINLGNSENFWSSTQYYNTDGWYMTMSGKCDSRSKSAGNVVIPVLEIPNT